MDNRLREALIERLTDLGNGDSKPRKPHVGICAEISHLSKLHRKSYTETMDHIRKIWKKCPKFSGYSVTPIVPSDNYFDDISVNLENGLSLPKKASLAYSHTDLMWGSHEYGDLRRELCLFTAIELRKGAQI